MAVIKMQSDASLALLPLFTGIAVLLFASSWALQAVGWLPNPDDAFGDPVVIEALAAASAAAKIIRENAPSAPQLPGKWGCAECGVIQSMRAIEENEAVDATSPHQPARFSRATRYEFTVRLFDGSHRLITDSNRAAWRLGERLNIIDGMHPSKG